MFCITIRGTVRQQGTGIGIAGLFVRGSDKQRKYTDLFGFGQTDDYGRFVVANEPKSFRDFFEKMPEVFLEVLSPDRKRILYTTSDPVPWNSGNDHFMEILVPPKRLGRFAVKPSLALVDEDGRLRNRVEIGDVLAVQADGLSPIQPHQLVLRDEPGRALFITSVVTGQDGSTGVVTIWPQLGLDDPRRGKSLSHKEAAAQWGDKQLRVELRQGDRQLLSVAVPIVRASRRPLLFASDSDGRVLNGFQVGQQDVILTAHNLPFRGSARIFLVPRQHDWQPGNTFEAILLISGRLAFADAEIGRDGRLSARLARGREVAPGAYDFIVRPLRYGYEDDEDFHLRPTDLVTRSLTGVVVRQEFMISKAVRGGCANTQPISGRTISGPPYFQYADTFQVGEDVWAALDPLALDPALVGQMVALYVVPHKTAAQWTADPSLTHLAVLGGNPDVPKFKTQSSCINYNKVKIWPNATQVGEYDIVADFGNNTPNASLFVPDNTYNMPLDIIDGYFVAGFRVVQDPTTDAQFANAGTFTYNDGPVTVTDDFGSVTVDLKAIVYFPADIAGATMPSQISAAQATYPMVIVVHGNSSALTSYLGYNYLLEHLAKNGFIAASIHLNPGMAATGRARILFEHINLLKTKFGTTAANNIGIMGHSRGGEAVVAATRINHQEALGHSINAVVSLAPTDWILHETFASPWSKPYLVIYGSMDGDVAGVAQTGFFLYDRTSGQPKCMVFVYGSTHGRYNTVWGDTDITAGWSALGAGDLPKLISADAHQKIAKGYMTAFFRLHLKAETRWSGIFRGEWRPAAVEQADSGNVKLYIQYEDTVRREVDNFQGGHSAGAWLTSTIGGDDNSLPVDPAENELTLLDIHSPHDTGGLELRWDALSDHLRFDIPAAQKNVTSFAALSFRVGQKTGSASNPAGLPQDLYATINDTSAKSRSVLISKFAEIPPPHERAKPQYTKSAMRTVRIPLHVYTIAIAGQTPVDLQNVESVTFDFNVKTAGEIHIDSVEFTN